MVWRPFACLLLLTGAAAMARAQMPFDLPKAAPQDGASLFANHCGTCHTTQHDAPGFARVGFVWDDAHLDAWLTTPQKLIPGAVMLYRQDDPSIRRRIIVWLKEQL